METLQIFTETKFRWV